MLNNENGFIALISSIIISAVLMAVVFSLSFSGFFTRFNILDSELKDRSYELAYACYSIASLKLAADPAYIGNEADISVGPDKCDILLITKSGSQATITTKAVIQSNKATTRLEVVVDTVNFSVVSMSELPKI